MAGPLAGFIFLIPRCYRPCFSKVLPGIKHRAACNWACRHCNGWRRKLIFPGVRSADIYLHPVARAAWVGMFATAMNLLPVGQLDGGHVVYALFGRAAQMGHLDFPRRAAADGLVYWNGWLVLGRAAVLLRPQAPAGLRSHRDRRGQNSRRRCWRWSYSFSASRSRRSTIERRAMKISATIVTLNEERNIARAIESLRLAAAPTKYWWWTADRPTGPARSPPVWARGSSKSRGVVMRPRKISRPPCGSHDWILSIDADEELTPELAAEIAALKRQTAISTAGPCRGWPNIWAAGSATAAGIPDRKVRLYHRDRGRGRANMSMKACTSRARSASSKAICCTSPATRFGAPADTGPLHDPGRAGAERARKTGSLRRLVVDPPWTFVRTYILQRGFLDGPQGFVIAWMASFLHVPEVRQGPREHALMRILHLDSGREMRGRPVAGAAAASGACSKPAMSLCCWPGKTARCWQKAARAGVCPADLSGHCVW